MNMTKSERKQSLLLERKKRIQEALDMYNINIGTYGYTILRAARDGLLQVKDNEGE